jgi:hypothetical protein
MSTCSRHMCQHVQDSYINMFKIHMSACSRHMSRFSRQMSTSSRHMCQNVQDLNVNMFKTHVNMFKICMSTSSRHMCQHVQGTCLHMFKARMLACSRRICQHSRQMCQYVQDTFKEWQLTHRHAQCDRWLCIICYTIVYQMSFCTNIFPYILHIKTWFYEKFLSNLFLSDFHEIFIINSRNKYNFFW